MALAEFADELERLLSDLGKPELVSQLPDLTILDRCRCEDDFCATFYTVPKREGSYGPDHYTLSLSPNDGMVNIDVAAGKIACVEVLYRDDVRGKLRSALP